MHSWLTVQVHGVICTGVGFIGKIAKEPLTGRLIGLSVQSKSEKGFARHHLLGVEDVFDSSIVRYIPLKGKGKFILTHGMKKDA